MKKLYSLLSVAILSCQMYAIDTTTQLNTVKNNTSYDIAISGTITCKHSLNAVVAQHEVNVTLRPGGSYDLGKEFECAEIAGTLTATLANTTQAHHDAYILGTQLTLPGQFAIGLQLQADKLVR